MLAVQPDGRLNWLDEHWRPAIRFKSGFSLSRLDIFYSISIARADIESQTVAPRRADRASIDPRDAFLGLLDDPMRRLPPALAAHTFRRLAKLQRFYEVTGRARPDDSRRGVALAPSLTFSAAQVASCVIRAVDAREADPAWNIVALLPREPLVLELEELVPSSQVPAFQRVAEAVQQGGRFENIFCEEEAATIPKAREVATLNDGCGYLFVEVRSKDFVIGRVESHEPSSSRARLVPYMCGDLLVVPKHLCQTIAAGAGDTAAEAWASGQELKQAKRVLAAAARRAVAVEERLDEVVDRADEAQEDWWDTTGPSLPQASFALGGGKGVYRLIPGSVLPLISAADPYGGFHGGRLRSARRKGAGQQIALLGVVALSGHETGPRGGAMRVQMDKLIRVGLSEGKILFEGVAERPLLGAGTRSCEGGLVALHTVGWPSAADAEAWFRSELSYFVRSLTNASRYRTKLQAVAEAKRSLRRAEEEKRAAAARVRALRAKST